MDFEDETAVSDPIMESENDEQEMLFDPMEALEEDDAPPEEPTAVFRPSSPHSKVSLESLIAYFAACGRCGYFLTGYRAALGLANLQKAVEQAKSGWISLTWNDAVRDLVLKSYASAIEENDFHFEGCCLECRRHFIYRAPDSSRFAHTFRIEVKPRKRQ